MLLRKRRDGAAAALAGAAAAAAATVPTRAGDCAAATTDPTAAAFFDCDNTLLAGASIYYFARGLAARNYFSARDLVAFGRQQIWFRLSGRENRRGMSDAREAALAFVAGRSVKEIVAYGEEIYDELMAERIYAGTRELAQQHLDAGQQVWLVTATPIELARVVADRLGLTGALGTVAENENGIYTGRLLGEPLHGPAKAEAVRALAEREGFDLDRCSAYSDSANDLPMLSLVGHPMAINPDPDLRRAARANGWPARDFRTARKAARIGVPAAGGIGMLAGALVAAAAVRRRTA
jgi:HAD superfamily hydrolase (TIGR01490 family)